MTRARARAVSTFSTDGFVQLRAPDVIIDAAPARRSPHDQRMGRKRRKEPVDDARRAVGALLGGLRANDADATEAAYEAASAAGGTPAPLSI